MKRPNRHLLILITISSALGGIILLSLHSYHLAYLAFGVAIVPLGIMYMQWQQRRRQQRRKYRPVHHHEEQQ